MPPANTVDKYHLCQSSGARHVRSFCASQTKEGWGRLSKETYFIQGQCVIEMLLCMLYMYLYMHIILYLFAHVLVHAHDSVCIAYMLRTDH